MPGYMANTGCFPASLPFRTGNRTPPLKGAFLSYLILWDSLEKYLIMNPRFP